MSAPSVALWPHLQRIAQLACEEFKLYRFKKLEPVTEQTKREYGRCFEDGTVKLRVYRFREPRRALSRRIIVGTLAHELAHLREWRHGQAHTELTRKIIEFWKERGLA